MAALRIVFLVLAVGSSACWPRAARRRIAEGCRPRHRRRSPPAALATLAAAPSAPPRPAARPPRLRPPLAAPPARLPAPTPVPPRPAASARPTCRSSLGFYARLRADFPRDYAAALGRDGPGPPPDAAIWDALRDLEQSGGVLAAQAGPAALDRFFDARSAVLAGLAPLDARRCVDFLYGVTDAGIADFTAAHRGLVATPRRPHARRHRGRAQPARRPPGPERRRPRRPVGGPRRLRARAGRDRPADRRHDAGPAAARPARLRDRPHLPRRAARAAGRRAARIYGLAAQLLARS